MLLSGITGSVSRIANLWAFDVIASKAREMLCDDTILLPFEAKEDARGNTVILKNFVTKAPLRLTKLITVVHMNVVPRSTMNTNGETEN